MRLALLDAQRADDGRLGGVVSAQEQLLVRAALLAGLPSVHGDGGDMRAYVGGACVGRGIAGDNSVGLFLVAVAGRVSAAAQVGGGGVSIGISRAIVDRYDDHSVVHLARSSERACRTADVRACTRCPPGSIAADLRRLQPASLLPWLLLPQQGTSESLGRPHRELPVGARPASLPADWAAYPLAAGRETTRHLGKRIHEPDACDWQSAASARERRLHPGVVGRRRVAHPE